MIPRKKTPAAKRKQMRLYTTLGLLGVLGFAVFLMLRAFEENILFFVIPSDLKTGEFSGEEQFRLGGLVEVGSVKLSTESPEVKFFVTDGEVSIPVQYKGLLPDLFREGQGIVVEGRLGADGIFKADTVLAKHDENYMPPEVAEALKEKGYWREDENSPEGS